MGQLFFETIDHETKTTMNIHGARYRTCFHLCMIAGLLILLLYPTGIMGKAYRNPIQLLSYDTFLCSALFGAFFIGLPNRKASNDVKKLSAIATSFFLALIAYEPITDLSDWKLLYCRLGASIGLAAITLLVYRYFSHTDPNRSSELSQSLYPALLLPLYVYISGYLLNLTISLHPLVYDPILYAVDQSFGFQISFAMGQFFSRFSFLKNIMAFIYISLPLFVGISFRTCKFRNSLSTYQPDGLIAFLLAGVFGYCLYHFYPVVGPTYMFHPAFPFDPPNLSTLDLRPVAAPLVHRNCMPSLHFGWALLCMLQARYSIFWIRGLAVIYLISTILVIFAFGFHYAIDAVVAIPFVLAIHAVSYLDIPLSGWRKQAVLSGALWTLVWMILLKWFPTVLYSPTRLWGLTILCTGHCGWTYHHLNKHANLLQSRSISPSNTNQKDLTTNRWSIHRSMALVFALSGVSGLIYEVLFAKKLSLIFGSTAMASAIVLSAYMGGMAFGSWMGGKLGEQTKNPIMIYVGCEIGIGLICFFSAPIFQAIQYSYIHLTKNLHPASATRMVFQYILGCIGLFPPTVLMGITLPVLVRVFGDRGEAFGPVVGLLYGANTIGAALGALASGYILLPSLGMLNTARLAVTLNLAAALFGYRIWKTYKNTMNVFAYHPHPRIGSSNRPCHRNKELTTLWIILGIGGVLTFALETIYVHLLAIVAGNSTYAFSLMLFTFLLGLGIGSAIIRRLLRQDIPPVLLLISCEIGLAATVLFGLPAWNALPDYFASFEYSSIVLGFGAREFIRGIVCFLVMLPPALCIGAIYPATMDLVGSFSGHSIEAMGKAVAINTLGNIAGAVIGGFVWIPAMGSFRALQLVAAVGLFLAFLAWIILRFYRKRVWILILSLLYCGTSLLLPRNFDLNRLSSGANVYFREQRYGDVIDHVESMDGGLTTVAQQWLPNGKRKLTLLTNGKFQGDDGTQHEMLAQTGFALCPLLHTTKRESALVIGYGVGVSTRTIVDAKFDHVDLVDLSRDIIDMAERYFQHVNRQVTKRDNVATFITDGRHFLLTRSNRYDLISMEVTSIWFVGAGNLYNREFYQLVKERLNPGGVFQQWLQLHHLYPSDIVTVLTTLRCEFPFVWLYFVGSQGVLVASQEYMPWSEDAVRVLDNTASLQEIISLHGGSIRHLQDTLLLDNTQMDRMFEEYGGCRFASTDDNLLLEYSTPKGNWRNYNRSTQENIAFLRSFGVPRAQ